MMLRVGGSSWRPKIDPKRPQEMKNNDFEEDRTRRGEKKDNEDDKKKQKRAPESLLNKLGGHLELPRSPQEHRK